MNGKLCFENTFQDLHEGLLFKNIQSIWIFAMNHFAGKSTCYTVLF